MPYLDSLYRIHLEWMFENQPSLVRELLRKNKLKAHLDQVEQQALKLVMDLQESGMPTQEALERATAEIMAPPNGPAISQDPAPKAIPEEERRIIYQRLQALGNAQDRPEQKKSTRH